MACSVPFWPILGRSGWFWPVLAGSGQSWLVLAGSGQSWLVLAGSGWFWPVLAGSGQSWLGLPRRSHTKVFPSGPLARACPTSLLAHTLAYPTSLGQFGSCQPLGNGATATGDGIHSALWPQLVIDIVIDVLIDLSDSSSTSDQLCDQTNTDT